MYRLPINKISPVREFLKPVGVMPAGFVLCLLRGGKFYTARFNLSPDSS